MDEAVDVKGDFSLDMKSQKNLPAQSYLKSGETSISCKKFKVVLYAPDKAQHSINNFL